MTFEGIELCVPLLQITSLVNLKLKKLILSILCASLLSSPLIGTTEGTYQIISDIETETMNFSAEVSHGFVNGSHGVDLWYVWVNTSGTHMLFLAMHSAMYPSPINYFIGQHYFTSNGTEVFVGNRFLGFEIYEDLNGNSLLDVNYNDGFDKASDEATYFFHLNASKTIDLTPPSKSEKDNTTHYSWGIHYNLAQGILIEIDNNPDSYVNDPETGELLPSFFKGLSSATLSSISFSFDYWIENNTAYLKTGLKIGSFNEMETSTIAFDGKSLSTLYSTSVLSSEPYNIITTNSKQLNMETQKMTASEIDVNGEKAFKLVVGDSYTLQNEPTVFPTTAGTYSLDSLPGDLIYHAKHFTENTENIFKQYFQKTSPNIGSNASISIKKSSIIYRVCFPNWGNRALNYDPLYVAYLGQPRFRGLGKPSVSLPQTLLIVTFISGMVILGVAIYRHLKIRRYKMVLPKLS